MPVSKSAATVSTCAAWSGASRHDGGHFSGRCGSLPGLRALDQANANFDSWLAHAIRLSSSASAHHGWNQRNWFRDRSGVCRRGGGCDRDRSHGRVGGCCGWPGLANQFRALDVRDSAAVTKLVGDFDSLNVLVNCAGMLRAAERSSSKRTFSKCWTRICRERCGYAWRVAHFWRSRTGAS